MECSHICKYGTVLLCQFSFHSEFCRVETEIIYSLNYLRRYKDRLNFVSYVEGKQLESRKVEAPKRLPKDLVIVTRPVALSTYNHPHYNL